MIDGVVDYRGFAARLARACETAEGRDTLLADFHREWGFAGTVAEPADPTALGELGRTVLGFAPPAALIAWLAHPHNSFLAEPGLYETYLTWLPDDEDEPFVAAAATGHRGMYVFMAENQYCCEWAFSLDDIDRGLADPPVYVGTSEDADSWEVQSRSFTEWVIQVAIIRVLIDTAERWTWPDDVPAHPRPPALGTVLPEIGLLPWKELGNEVHFFGGEDTIVLHLPHSEGGELYDIEVFGRTEEAMLHTARLLHPGAEAN
ncbi:hypothetical protein [Embleya sp. NPDC020886]|uniref:hypothetical protein n=1 Tax=Embleya sp. NPDC020886 TaxID=3363980 RepID=UPI00379BBA57